MTEPPSKQPQDSLVQEVLHCTGTGNVEIHCFGMIVGLPYRQSREYDNEPNLPIPLQFEAIKGSLISLADGRTFGTFEQRTKHIVGALKREIQIQIFADYMPNVQERLQIKTTKRKRTSTRELAIFLILYGPAALADPVGSLLTKCELWLQHPKFCDRNVPYRNPHCLGHSSANIISTYDTETSLDLVQSLESDIPNNPIEMLADHHEEPDLPEASAPTALQTQLYQHQKQALSFMIRRESGRNFEAFQTDIWRREKNPFGRDSYINVISGTKRSKPPPESLGGILSDAPGLGKGLSMIALLAASRESGVQALSQGTVQDNGTTLLVVPKTLIQTWKDELQRHVRPDMPIRYCEYYGKNRISHLRSLENYDLVITTYAVVRLDWKASQDGSNEQICLHRVQWQRLILDEAHIIREPSKTFARSVYALQAQKRWAVTGTPIQNRLRDLFSLFKFLRCYPFDDFNFFKAHVIDSWRTRSDPNSIAKLKKLINCISLRRPKATIKLPSRTDNIIRLQFSSLELKHYKEVQVAARGKLDELDCLPQSGGVFMNALQWVNKLRLICNHGFYIDATARNPNGASTAGSAWSELDAQLCFDHLDHIGLAKCSTSGCAQDLSSALSSEEDSSNVDEPRMQESMELLCSSCYDEGEGGRSVKFFKVCNHLPRCKASTNRPSDGQLFGKFSSSQCSSVPTKIQAVINALERAPDGIKSVVFSSWTKTFDILQPLLIGRSIRCIRLDGSLSHTRRARVIRTFREDSGIKVLLATITCGGVGLDLTAASRAYIMEPQWNPMSESQALDRIHRLGQMKNVETVRYVMEGSWEERVLSLQQKKRSLADLALDEEEVDQTKNMVARRLYYLRQLVG